jgi:hypothetical protein
VSITEVVPESADPTEAASGEMERESPEGTCEPEMSVTLGGFSDFWVVEVPAMECVNRIHRVKTPYCSFGNDIFINWFTQYRNATGFCEGGGRADII